MAQGLKTGLGFAAVLLCVGTAMAVGPKRGAHPPRMPGPLPLGEPHPGPSGYQRVDAPKGWDARPTTFDRPAYQHNFQAARSYRIGPYRPPQGYAARHWTYGEVLPRVFWAPQYLIADYWLFALEVPPAGYEWVRYGADALLISTDNGEILQVEYGVFA